MNQPIGSVRQELLRRRDELRDFFIYLACEAQDDSSRNKVLAQEHALVDAAIREMADELTKIEQHLLELND